MCLGSFLSACLEVVPEVYSGKLFSPGKTEFLEPLFGYFFVRLGSAEMHSKMSLASTQNLQFSMLKHHLQTGTNGDKALDVVLPAV